MEFARFSPLGLGTLVLGMLLGHAVMLADELPKDTNEIKSLTPEQARKLVEEFLPTTAEFKIESGTGFGWGKVPVSSCLPLNGLTSLDAETAKALVRYDKGPLLLNGLTTLDAKTAEALADFNGGRLLLDGLTTLNADTAKALAEFEGRLYLNGLTALNAETATLLAQFKAQCLWLDGLNALDADTAMAIAGYKGCKGVSTLSLDGLTTLDTETAGALAGLKCRDMYLNGLTKLDTATAKAIAGFKGAGLDLNGLTTLDAKTAKALADFRGGGLRLDGLTTLNADTAKALAGFWRRLFLNGLTTIDADTATALVEFEGGGRSLELNGLTTLDAETAKALAKHKGGLSLPLAVRESFFMANVTPETASRLAALFHGDLSFVTTLDTPDSVAIAQALAKHKGPLKLPNLTKISPKTLTALLKKEDVQIPLIETLELIAEPDGSATEDFVIPEGFKNGRQRQSK